jgi:hypothetical protein
LVKQAENKDGKPPEKDVAYEFSNGRKFYAPKEVYTA